MADRHEWARQQEEQSKRRMEAFRAKLENTPVVPHSAPATVVKHQQPRAQPTTRKEKEVKQVKQIFDDLMSAHPEFAARRRVALQVRFGLDIRESDWKADCTGSARPRMN